jgi:hypothetical protein
MSITTAGRSLSNDMTTQVSASELAPIILASLSFSTPVHLWSGYGTITYNGTGYLGIGTLGTISPIEETTDLAARGISLQLSGVPTAQIAIALTENYQGRECSILFAAMASDGTLVSTPVTVFSGRMDVMTINDDGEQAIIGMTAENKLVDFSASARTALHGRGTKVALSERQGAGVRKCDSGKGNLLGQREVQLAGQRPRGRELRDHDLRMIARRDNWPDLLSVYIEEKRSEPFAWGSNDCCLFAADWVQIATGHDIAAQWRGSYTTALGARRALDEGGGIERAGRTSRRDQDRDGSRSARRSSRSRIRQRRRARNLRRLGRGFYFKRWGQIRSAC